MRFLRSIERLVHHLRDPYRPELHYMRGPGPRCAAKQARRAEDEASEPTGRAREAQPGDAQEG